MRQTTHNIRGIHTTQLNILSSELVEVYVQYTGQYVWLPAQLVENQYFMEIFCLQPIAKKTALAFSKAYQLGYARIPSQQYLQGIETFLRRLQNGERHINDLYMGQCPHLECMRFINNMDSGHFCLADDGNFTIKHQGRKELGLPKKKHSQ